MILQNIFKTPKLPPGSEELFETLCQAPGLHIERIVSQGQHSPPGEWYDQKQHEWVVLLQGEAVLEFEHGPEQKLVPGDYLLIPAGLRHRVAYTSTQPACIWLAIHFNKEQHDEKHQ